MITKVTPIEQLKQGWIELLLDKTDAVSKVADGSVLNGIAYGDAKTAQKILANIALIESYLFPDSAFGEHLDKIARIDGIAERFGATNSTTYLRVSGDIGTLYDVGTVFQSTNGVNFVIDTDSGDYEIGNWGFGYVKVRSQLQGASTNVNPLTITKVTPIPTGHQYVINEYAAFGGRDIEEDITFRQRIKEGANIMARGTLAMLEQVFNKINNRVLRIFHQGIDGSGNVKIAILTSYGANLSNAELETLILQAQKFFGLTEYYPNGYNGRGILLSNIEWQAVDISIRLKINPAAVIDDVRKEIQVRMNKYFDYRQQPIDNQNQLSKIEWDDLLEITKRTPGVDYVLDTYFSPHLDILIERNKLPRVRGFLLLNPNGLVLTNDDNTLNPIFYPPQADFSFQQTALNSII